MNAKELEARKNILKIYKDIGDISNRVVPTVGTIYSEIVMKPKSGHSGMNPDFVNNMNA